MQDDSSDAAALRDALTAIQVRERTNRDSWRRQEAIWSWLRLALFVAAFVPWFWGIALIWRAALFAIGMAVFSLAVRRHQRIQARRESAERMLLVVEEALQRAGGQVVCVRSGSRPPAACQAEKLPELAETGADWQLTGQERDDLDLLGDPVGVFGLLNRTSAALGAARLLHMLERPLLSSACIRRRQQTVRPLAEDLAARAAVMAGFAALRGEDARLNRVIDALDTVRPLKTRIPSAVVRAWSLLCLAAWILGLGAMLGGDLSWGAPLGLLVGINAVILVSLRRQLQGALTPWRDTAWALRALETALTAAVHLPDGGDLPRYREAAEAALAERRLPKLRWRVTWTESGGLFYQVLNLILLMDVLVAHGILRVAVPLRRPLLQGVATVRDVDALCSLAAFAAEQPRRCWPELVDDLQLTITRGTHPLLDPGRAVPNDLTLHHDCRLWIVTGSNMAGKSTYLRMIGLNVLFAQVGTAVCAEALSLCPLRLVSDLRARDDLGRNESYFLAEVRHLRRMVLPPPGATPILGLIDEPFRGTNSDDQTAASVAVVRHLLEQPNLYVLATHDRHLTGLADGVRARNWHFQENITADEMVFDYRLHAGPAQTRNALRILERELYPPELVTAARRWLEQSDS